MTPKQQTLECKNQTLGEDRGSKIIKNGRTSFMDDPLVHSKAFGVWKLCKDFGVCIWSSIFFLLITTKEADFYSWFLLMHKQRNEKTPLFSLLKAYRLSAKRRVAILFEWFWLGWEIHSTCSSGWRVGYNFQSITWKSASWVLKKKYFIRLR